MIRVGATSNVKFFIQEASFVTVLIINLMPFVRMFLSVDAIYSPKIWIMNI